MVNGRLMRLRNSDQKMSFHRSSVADAAAAKQSSEATGGCEEALVYKYMSEIKYEEVPDGSAV